MAKENYIKLYAEDFDTDVWEDYCRIVGVPNDSVIIKIRFTDDDVSYVGPETFTVDIYDDNDDYYDSFDIVARGRDEAEKIVENLYGMVIDNGSYCEVEIINDLDDGVLCTLTQGFSTDIEEVKDWVDNLSFKLVIIR